MTRLSMSKQLERRRFTSFGELQQILAPIKVCAWAYAGVDEPERLRPRFTESGVAGGDVDGVAGPDTDFDRNSLIFSGVSAKIK